ncbi:MAG: hypothetical protein LBV36_00415, partial [Chromatiales bacterium]|nr:hypothetical protein [Chromatiales bacterium]
MRNDEETGRRPGAVAGLLEAARSIFASGVDMARLRVEMLRAEVWEEFARMRSALLFAMLAVFFLVLAMACVSVLLVTVFWETHR